MPLFKLSTGLVEVHSNWRYSNMYFSRNQCHFKFGYLCSVDFCWKRRSVMASPFLWKMRKDLFSRDLNLKMEQDISEKRSGIFSAMLMYCLFFLPLPESNCPLMIAVVISKQELFLLCLRQYSLGNGEDQNFSVLPSHRPCSQKR